jgi:hypothetical protein
LFSFLSAAINGDAATPNFLLNHVTIQVKLEMARACTYPGALQTITELT